MSWLQVVTGGYRTVQEERADVIAFLKAYGTGAAKYAAEHIERGAHEGLRDNGSDAKR